MSKLSERGHNLAAQSFRKKFKFILEDPYDPKTNPDGFVNVGTAENYAMLPEVVEFVNQNFKVEEMDLNYGQGPWGTPRLRKAMANHMHIHFPTINPIDPDDLICANGVTSLCEMLGFAIGEPGDGFLLARPIYQAFQMDFSLKAKLQPVWVPFGDTDQFSVDAVPMYEKAVIEAQKAGIRVRALMLCNPHNPLGRCYPKDTLIGLMQLCQKYEIHLMVDEIYALSVYHVPGDPHAVKFHSALSFDSSDYISTDFLHVIYGMSKDAAAGGLRLGCLYTRNEELMDALSAITQFHWSGGPSDVIATKMLEDQKWMNDFAKLSRERLATRNMHTRKTLEENGIAYTPGANAGFFIWMDLRPFLPKAKEGVDAKDNWEGEGALLAKMMENKVFITNGQQMGSEEAGWFRIIFSQDEAVLKEGMKRMIQTLKKVQGISWSLPLR